MYLMFFEMMKQLTNIFYKKVPFDRLYWVLWIGVSLYSYIIRKNNLYTAVKIIP